MLLRFEYLESECSKNVPMLDFEVLETSGILDDLFISMQGFEVV